MIAHYFLLYYLIMERTNQSLVKTLNRVPHHNFARIMDIDGGWGLRQSIIQLGLHIGDTIQIIRAGTLGGPTLICFNNTRIAIGHGMAEKIKVEICTNEE